MREIAAGEHVRHVSGNGLPKYVNIVYIQTSGTLYICIYVRTSSALFSPVQCLLQPSAPEARHLSLDLTTLGKYPMLANSSPPFSRHILRIGADPKKIGPVIMSPPPKKARKNETETVSWVLRD